MVESLRDSMKYFLSKVLQSISFENGGDKRDRTADLLNAIQALSQLSYTPISHFRSLVGQNGLALLRQSHANSRFTNWKPSEAGFNWRGEVDLQGSVSLSVKRGICKAYFDEMVGQNGLEPSTSRLSVVCSSQLSYWPILTSSNKVHALSIVNCQLSIPSVPSKLNNVNP